MNDSPISHSSKYGVVTFLDVLGWKGIWQRKNNAITDLESLVKSLYKIVESSERGKSTEPTSIMIVSDTIVLFTSADYDNVTKKIDLHGRLCKEAIPNSIKKGIPLRGATSFGEVIISKTQNIFAGKAIDEAASWHEKADWIGVFLTPSANFVFNDSESKYWVEYEPPIKNNLEYKTHSVIWFNHQDIKTKVMEIKKDFSQLAPIFPEIVEKFTNTINFIEDFKSKNDALS